LKIASGQDAPFTSFEFWAGAILYMLTAAGWMLAMKHLSLATIGVFYSIPTLFLLTSLGVLVFRETLTLRDVAGIEKREKRDIVFPRLTRYRCDPH
jgi:drug/metabolite transporter (DMT)-like permease